MSYLTPKLLKFETPLPSTTKNLNRYTPRNPKAQNPQPKPPKP